MKSAEAFPGAAFWHEALTLDGAARVAPRTVVFGVIAAVVGALQQAVPWLTIRADVMEASGLVLELLLVFRTAGGYERWWEARRLWGEIINQSRNLAVAALVNGPLDRAWREELVRWTIAFSQTVRASLRDERLSSELARLLGEDNGQALAQSHHMPSYVSERIATLLREARAAGSLDSFAFIQIDRDRAALLDHAGGCERILATPIPKIYSETIRRFVVLYLFALPFALSQAGLFSPAYTLLIAYPVLSLEQIGAELQNPFVKRSLSHLDLEKMCATIQENLEDLLRLPPGSSRIPRRVA